MTGHGSDEVEHPTLEERAAVRAQMGREPRGSWRVGSHCGYGYPQTVVTAPVLDDGTPFPTLFWLTCPFLVEAVGTLESTGEGRASAELLARDRPLAARMLAADARYRELRAAEAGPECADPCGAVGIAGQADPLATKCLHAHVAAFLGTIDDPVGESVVESVGRQCDDARCDGLLAPEGGAQ